MLSSGLEPKTLFSRHNLTLFTLRPKTLCLANPTPHFAKESPLILVGEHSLRLGHRAKVAHLNPLIFFIFPHTHLTSNFVTDIVRVLHPHHIHTYTKFFGKISNRFQKARVRSICWKDPNHSCNVNGSRP